MRSQNLFTDLLLEHAHARQTLYVVGSNLAFDLWVLDTYRAIGRAGFQLEFFYDRGMTFILKVRRQKASIVFLSIQNWYEGGIAELGEMVRLKKLPIDFARATDEELSTYCRRDVEILVRVMERHLETLDRYDMGSFSLSASSQAYHAFRHAYLRDRILVEHDTDIKAWERGAYYGARCEAVRPGRHADQEYALVDVNGMFPYVMRDRPYPCECVGVLGSSTPEELSDILQQYSVIADVTLSTAEPLYPVREDDRVRYPTGEVATRLPSESCRQAIARGHIVRVGRVRVYRHSHIFRPWVSAMWRIRRQRQRGGDAVGQAFIKGLMNRLYGKFGQQAEVVTRREEVSPEYVYREVVPILGTHRRVTTTVLCGVKEVSDRVEPAPESIPSISAHVTDYARWELNALCDAVGWDNVMYYDTDGLIVPAGVLQRFGARLGSTRLGGIKIVDRGTPLTIYRAKHYILGERQRCSGLKATAREVAEGCWEQDEIPTLEGLMAGGRPGLVPIIRRRKQVLRSPDSDSRAGNAPGTVLRGRVEVSGPTASAKALEPAKEAPAGEGRSDDTAPQPPSPAQQPFLPGLESSSEHLR
jgi:hypothetical protein